MTFWRVLISVITGLLVTGIATVGLVALVCPAAPRQYGGANPARRITDGEEGLEWAEITGFWPTRWVHDAQQEPFTVAEAHAEMQRHRACRAEDCRRKREAFCVLVRAGHATPDRRSEKYLFDSGGFDPSG